MNRYARQEILPEVGADGQAKLAAAHALVVGAGGLGVPVLQYLAGAGVGRITIIDGDLVEESNLHRQPLYRMNHIGQPKATCAAEMLRSINPQIEITPRVEWLDPETISGDVADASIVLDCADTFAASITLSDACLATNTPLISASALGLSGYVGGFCGGAPSLRAVFPDLPTSAATCATAGVMGPVVAVIGAAQAQMALAVLLQPIESPGGTAGHPPAAPPGGGFTPTRGRGLPSEHESEGLANPLGQLFTLDARTWRTSTFRFDSAPEPDTPLPFIAPAQIVPGDMIIDLRSEAPRPFRPDAMHIDTTMLANLPIPPHAPRVVLACRTGLRAQNAGQSLQSRWPGDIALISLPPE